MGLDDAIAAIEAETAEKLEKDRLNRVEVDEACKRFAELAVTHSIARADIQGAQDGWLIIGGSGSTIVVHPTGHWDSLAYEASTGYKVVADHPVVPDADLLVRRMAKIITGTE